MNNCGRYVSLGLATALAALMALAPAPPANADPEPIRLKSTTATSQFPNGFRISMEAESDNEITSATIHLEIGVSDLSSSGRMRIRPGKSVTGELNWRRYVPPGTLVTYQIELEDASGARLETDKQQFVYHDIRFEWSEISKSAVTIAYHGPVRKRAELLLDIMLQTIQKMAPILGIDVDQPVRATMYNTPVEMFDALPPNVQARSRDLLTAGQASPVFGTLLVLGGSRGSMGIASHEMTHILTYRAGASTFRRVPLWLEEGLSEYANVEPDSDYDIALEFAVANETLLPSFGRSYPRRSTDTIVFYAQSRSIVRFMIERFGTGKMTELMTNLKRGEGNLNSVIEETYGIGLEELENIWLEKVKVEYDPTERARALRPTPEPRRELLPYSLTPLPNTEFVGAKSVAPADEPSSEVASAAPEEATAGSESAAALEPALEEKTQETLGRGSGGGCLASLRGGSGALDLAALGLLVGMAGLHVRRRRPVP